MKTLTLTKEIVSVIQSTNYKKYDDWRKFFSLLIYKQVSMPKVNLGKHAILDIELFKAKFKEDQIIDQDYVYQSMVESTIVASGNYEDLKLTTWMGNDLQKTYRVGEVPQSSHNLVKPVVTEKPMESFMQPTIVENVPNAKTKIVADIEVGDICYLRGLGHYFIVLKLLGNNTAFGTMVTSTLDLGLVNINNNQPVSFNTRFLNKLSYVNNTVSIISTNILKNCWAGYIDDKEVILEIIVSLKKTFAVGL